MWSAANARHATHDDTDRIDPSRFLICKAMLITTSPRPRPGRRRPSR
jgi:hypothetical protein